MISPLKDLKSQGNVSCAPSVFLTSPISVDDFNYQHTWTTIYPSLLSQKTAPVHFLLKELPENLNHWVFSVYCKSYLIHPPSAEYPYDNQPAASWDWQSPYIKGRGGSDQEFCFFVGMPSCSAPLAGLQPSPTSLQAFSAHHCVISSHLSL